MPATPWGWEITPEELRSWILEDNEHVLVLNKPPMVVCHPSKRGPWSSLIGACREYLGAGQLHMPSRLDRETSGVLVIAKDSVTASRLQRAAAKRRVQKQYWAILHGCLAEPRVVCEPIGTEPDALYYGRQQVSSDGRPAQTEFVPVGRSDHYTLARVHPLTGRLHQIRVHASHIGHPIAGDKLYPNAGPMMEFIREGLTDALRAALPIPRQALHAATIAFSTALGDEVFRAPLAPDMIAFCREQMGIEPPSEP